MENNKKEQNLYLTKFVRNMKKFAGNVKTFFGNLKEKMLPAMKRLNTNLNEIALFRHIADFVRSNRLVFAMAAFAIVALILILVPILAWQEFVVPVCVLIVLQTVMAVLLHRSELWIHGVLLAAELLAGYLMDRFPMAGICVLTYIAATLALQFAFKRTEDGAQQPEKPVVKPVSKKMQAKKDRHGKK